MRWLKATFPYWIAGIGCYAPILARRLGVGPYTWRSSHVPLNWATDSLFVSSIGFPFIALVFFLWRPQSNRQLAFGICVSFLLFIGPAFQFHAIMPEDYVAGFRFRVDASIVASCMVASLVVPAFLSYCTGIRLESPSISTQQRESIGQQGAIWELFFITFCCAVCAALLMSVNRGIQSFDGAWDDVWLFRGLAPIVMCLGVSIATTVLLSCRCLRRTGKHLAVCFALAILSLAAFYCSCLAEYDFFPNLSVDYILKRVIRRTLTLSVVAAFAVFAFIVPLLGIGYRFGTALGDNSDDDATGFTDKTGA